MMYVKKIELDKNYYLAICWKHAVLPIFLCTVLKKCEAEKFSFVVVAGVYKLTISSLSTSYRTVRTYRPRG